ncbi:MAG: aminoglycoside phosphotransferase family protein [Clostridia bacterium]|nr:aminoglycoside phosphotransferase family protein [Clostridia bacterium]
MENKSYNFEETIKHFMFEGEFIEAVPYGCGHINDTFAAYFKKSFTSTHRYILQRINHNVFKNPEKLMENIEGVTSHLRNKIKDAGGDPFRETLNLIPVKEGKSYYRDISGNYWRAYIFIENAKTYQTVESKEHFYNTGIAFGNFQKLLADYPAQTLYETIPDFHNTKKRYSAFEEALQKDVKNRSKYVKSEIEFVQKRACETSALVDLQSKGMLPLRVTHNDTKLNNVMIDDKTGKAVCVIDLDTVMPGLSLYDYGDAIRFGTNTGAEDEKDLTKVSFDLELFEGFTKGFLESTRGFLTELEREYLPFSAKLMTLECGIRFLTDYLNGDTYFKIQREEHNLDRCRTQFRMVMEMEEKFDEMKKIVINFR